MTGLFLPGGGYRACAPRGAPPVEWRRLAGVEPYRVVVGADPVRVVLTQRYVDEVGAVREQVQVFGSAGDLVVAIAMNDYVAAVRGRIASDLADAAIALGLPEAELDCAVEAISRQLHGGSADTRRPPDAAPEAGAP